MRVHTEHPSAVCTCTMGSSQRPWLMECSCLVGKGAVCGKLCDLGHVACLAGQAGQKRDSMLHLVTSGACSFRLMPEQGLCAPLSKCARHLHLPALNKPSSWCLSGIIFSPATQLR